MNANNSPVSKKSVSEKEEGGVKASSSAVCLYRGKNFVFDPRRTDPIVGNGITIPVPLNNTQSLVTLTVDGDSVERDGNEPNNIDRVSLVGRCIICSSPHDDYDNGNAPSEGKESRCCRCRVLVLVCDDCRQHVRCWGEPEFVKGCEIFGERDIKQDLFCGHAGKKCVDEGNVAENVDIARF